MQGRKIRCPDLPAGWSKDGDKHYCPACTANREEVAVTPAPVEVGQVWKNAEGSLLVVLRSTKEYHWWLVVNQDEASRWYQEDALRKTHTLVSPAPTPEPRKPSELKRFRLKQKGMDGLEPLTTGLLGGSGINWPWWDHNYVLIEVEGEDS